MKENMKYFWMETALTIAVAVGGAILALVFSEDFKILVTILCISVTLLIAVNVGFLYFMRKKNASLIDMKELVDTISDSISGGNVHFKLDESLTILSVNKRFLAFCGYTQKDLATRFDNKFINLIEESHRSIVLDVIKNRSIEESKSQIFYPLLCADGYKDVINVFVLLSGGREAENFLIDLAAIKHVKEEKDIAAERYKIVAEQSESIIFDFNNIDKTISLNSYFKDKFGYGIQGNIYDNIAKDKLIFDEDLDRFMRISKEDKDYNEIEMRVKKSDGEYIWCKVRMTTLRNEEKKAVRLIGKIIDVDESRKEKQQLIEKASRDDMTGMYNKLFTEQLISAALKKDANTSLSAFLLFDIDNFKHINDEFGHMQGDSVLYQICDDLRLIFRSTDILGRIGGDEFLVFIKNISSEDHALKKARDILELIENKYSEEKDGFVVSVSVGISFYDKDGDTYKELFIKADKALYQAKRKGKNTFEVYKPE